MAFNRKAKLRDNIEAIRTVFELDKTKRQATPEEKEVLGRYCGFGGLKCILNPANDLSDTARVRIFQTGKKKGCHVQIMTAVFYLYLNEITFLFHK